MTRTIFFLTAAAMLCAALPATAQNAAPVSARSAAGARALADPDVITVRNVTRGELTPGLPIFEDGGATVGTVARLAGNDVILADGETEYRVSITDIYAYNQDGVDRFASRMTRAALKAQGNGAPAMAAQRGD